MPGLGFWVSVLGEQTVKDSGVKAKVDASAIHIRVRSFVCRMLVKFFERSVKKTKIYISANDPSTGIPIIGKHKMPPITDNIRNIRFTLNDFSGRILPLHSAM